MGKTSIEWTRGDDGTAGATWNPIRGCSRISPGCGGANHQGGCYAEKIAARFSGPGQPFEGFAERTAHGGRWTGRMAVVWDAVDQPIRWRKPRRIFANSMSDLFHKDLPMEEVAVIYGTAIAAVHLRKHTIQILTKRSDRMRELLNDEAFWELANSTAESLVMEHTDPLARRSDDARATFDDYGPDRPPPGIWLGVSVEDQQRADERIPDLLATPAAVRFLSCEPLLGPVDPRHINIGNGIELDAMTGYHSCSMTAAIQDIPKGVLAQLPILPKPTGHLSWVIAGGESGPKARPPMIGWFRSLRDQCRAAGVAFHFKQWGEFAPDDPTAEHTAMRRVGKKAAGAMLDGKLHREFPR